MTETLLYAQDFCDLRRIDLGEWELSADSVMDFARQWDPFPFHTDPDAALRSPFGGLVASGVHVMAILQVLQYRSFLGRTAIIAGLGFTDFTLRAPARAGARLAGTVDITDVRLRDDGRAIVHWDAGLTEGSTSIATLGAAAMIRQRQ
ncbi:MaoC/PaaZ C-terminal domain-containing protein [Nocardia alni]|uniref:MaoC/PaaZ C-terminal domain-containing protein n=1 Tax=Nocardia alni TaxID=2815723 RepID=UPI001C22CE30|nr:MaoC/PaaZ C-terminal domain-containing protein [Nocardia alni]